MICRNCLTRARTAATRALVPVQTTGPIRLPISSSRLLSTVSRSGRQFLQPQALQLGAPSRFFSTTPSAASDSAASAAAGPVKPEGLTEGEAAVWDRLMAELAPSALLVQDVSGGCGSMYSIDITAEQFRGLNMLKQQRVVNAVLADMVKEWHGLQLRTKAP